MKPANLQREPSSHSDIAASLAVHLGPMSRVLLGIESLACPCTGEVKATSTEVIIEVALADDGSKVKRFLSNSNASHTVQVSYRHRKPQQVPVTPEHPPTA
jgi:hypothetical protein